MDMTLSPYIAAYFAIESGYRDCSVFTFRYEYFTSIDKDSLDHEEDYKKLVFEDGQGTGSKAFFIPYEPKRTNPRLIAQQGLFLVPSTNYQTLDRIISLYEDCETACIQYIIPSGLRYEGIKFLRRMNITSSSLFPGIDSFCKSLRYQVVETVKHLKKIGQNS
ncbi:hypothetical protein ES705_41815 [subsurface metagenome]